jgi:hypothetical protein
MLESFVTLFEETRDPLHRDYAEAAADLFTTWTVSYNGRFPSGSLLDALGIETVGGVLANAQNHHIGPGSCTSSSGSLLRLYRYTGNVRYLRLLQDIATSLQQYVSYPDHAVGGLRTGMITEQINLTDALGEPGEIWEVSASWPQYALLLTYADVPGVYVDFDKQVTAVFDHLTVDTAYEARTLSIRNATRHAACTKVMVEGGVTYEIAIEAGAVLHLHC